MSNEQEIIDELQECLDIGDNDIIALYSEEVQMCIEALEKQIAKKPEVWANGTEHCPCCEKDVTNMYFKVCIECGQRLKEGEVDE